MTSADLSADHQPIVGRPLADHRPIAKTQKLSADGKKYDKVVIILFLSADEKKAKILHFIGRLNRPTVVGVYIIAVLEVL